MSLHLIPCILAALVLSVSTANAEDVKIPSPINIDENIPFVDDALGLLDAPPIHTPPPPINCVGTFCADLKCVFNGSVVVCDGYVCDKFSGSGLLPVSPGDPGNRYVGAGVDPNLNHYHVGIGGYGPYTGVFVDLSGSC